MKAFFKDVFRRMAVLFVSASLFAILSLVIFSFFAGSLFSPKVESIKKDSFLKANFKLSKSKFFPFLVNSKYKNIIKKMIREKI